MAIWSVFPEGPGEAAPRGVPDLMKDNGSDSAERLIFRQLPLQFLNSVQPSFPVCLTLRQLLPKLVDAVKPGGSIRVTCLQLSAEALNGCETSRAVRLAHFEPGTKLLHPIDVFSGFSKDIGLRGAKSLALLQEPLEALGRCNRSIALSLAFRQTLILANRLLARHRIRRFL